MTRFMSMYRLAIAAFVLWGGVAVAQQPRQLAVVELFQSQGCSSCPPAEANLNAIAGEPGVLALSYSVTYWDGLGWKDTFASEANTARQWDYAHYRGRDTVWTPQVYVNGDADLIGNDRLQLEAAIGHARSDGPSIAWSKESVTVSAAPARQAGDVWLVRYDPRTLRVAIGGGENRGRTLLQRNVVRELIHLGSWNGSEQAYAFPPPSLPYLMTATLVQARHGGPILSASIQGDMR